MNEVYLFGKVIKLGEFRFIYGDALAHKSLIKLWIETADENVIECWAYDDIADQVLRNDFEIVMLCGKIKSKGYVVINSIESIKSR